MVISVYEERGIEKGKKQGIEIGAVQAERKTLLRLREQKFGTLPEAVQSTIQQIEDVEELDRLLGQVLAAQSIEEMGLSRG